MQQFMLLCQTYWYIVFLILSIIAIILNVKVSFKAVNIKRKAGCAEVGLAVVPVLNIFTLIVVSYKVKANEKLNSMEFDL